MNTPQGHFDIMLVAAAYLDFFNGPFKHKTVQM